MATLVTDSFKLTPLPKSTAIVARKDGRLYVVDFTSKPGFDDPLDIDWDLSVSKLLISKIAMSRTRMTTLEEVEFESVHHTEEIPPGTTADMDITIFHTLDGKNIVGEGVKPALSIDDGEYVRANCRVTGRNFAVQLRGTYNINTVQVTLHLSGRR